MREPFNEAVAAEVKRRGGGKAAEGLVGTVNVAFSKMTLAVKRGHETDQ